MADYGQDLLNDGLERLQGEWAYRGQTFDLVVEDIGYSDWKLVQQYGALSAQVNAFDDQDDISEADVEALAEQAESLEDFSWEAPDENPDFVETLIDEKLVRPEVDLETTSSDKVGAIVEGMIQTWQRSHDVEAAEGEMPLDTGNP